MRFGTVILALATLAFAASLGICLWLTARYLPGYDVGAVFMDSDIVIKLMMLMTILLLAVIAVMTVIGLATRSSGVGLGLAILGAISALFGLLAFLYGWMRIQAGMAAVGGRVGLEITAPSWAEALLALSLGLSGAVLGLGVRSLILRQRRT